MPAISPSDVFAPPRGGSCVCVICHGPASSAGSHCWSCARIAAQIGSPLTPIWPLALVTDHSQLRELLTTFKAGTDPALRATARRELLCFAGQAIERHRSCLEASAHPRSPSGGRRAASAPFDLVVTVPSSGSGRRSWCGTHPLELFAAELLERCRWLLPPSSTAGDRAGSTATLRRGRGRLGHLRANRAGYRSLVSLEGRSVLLLDDTYASGARLQSAAAALRDAGASALSAIVLGRVLHESRTALSRAFTAWYASVLPGQAPCCSPGCFALDQGRMSRSSRRELTVSPTTVIATR